MAVPIRRRRRVLGRESIGESRQKTPALARLIERAGHFHIEVSDSDYRRDRP